jgi:hypothetical protein
MAAPGSVATAITTPLGKAFIFCANYGLPNLFTADFRREQIFRRRRPNSAAEGSSVHGATVGDPCRPRRRETYVER